MSPSALITAFERANGVPFARRSSTMMVQAVIVYTVLAAVADVWLLPAVLELSGFPLALARAGVVLVAGALAVYTVWRVRDAVTSGAQTWALAVSRGWTYTADAGDRPIGGSIEEQIPRKRRSLTAYLEADDLPIPFSTGVRTYTVGDGDGAITTTCRVVRIPLAAEVPRLVFVSRRAGILSGLPRKPQANQRLRLEGNFDDYFDTYVPNGYERDALYVLTPDLMVDLIDEAADCDVETRDGWLYVYSATVALSDADEADRLVARVQRLGARFSRRTELYRDDRAEAATGGAYSRAGDTLNANARTLRSRMTLGPVLAAVAAPVLLALVGIAWSWLLN